MLKRFGAWGTIVAVLGTLYGAVALWGHHGAPSAPPPAPAPSWDAAAGDAAGAGSSTTPTGAVCVVDTDKMKAAMAAVGGSGTGLAQDATVQQIIKLYGDSIPQGGTGTGPCQDASLQVLLQLIAAHVDGGGFVQMGGNVIGPSYDAQVVEVQNQPVLPADAGGQTWVWSGTAWVPTIVTAANPSPVVLQPIDGVSDDSVNMAAVFQANAYKNAVIMLPGVNDAGAPTHFQVLAPYVTPSGAYIIGTPGTEIDVNVPQTSISNGVFNMVAAESGFTTLISQVNTPGSVILTVQDNIAPVDSGVLAENASTGSLLANNFIVKAVTAAPGLGIDGGGAFALTLDRPNVYQFGSDAGDRVQLLNATTAWPAGIPMDTVIEGRGMKIVTTQGDILVELLGVRNVKVSGIQFFIRQNGINAITTDTGSSDCVISDNVVTVDSPPDGGWLAGTQCYWEQGNNHRFERNRCVSANAACLAVVSCTGCNATANEIERCGVAGITVTSDGNPQIPNATGFGNVLAGNHVTASNGAGVDIANGARQTSVVGNVSKFNASSGIRVGGSDDTVIPAEVTLSGNIASDNNNGLFINAGAQGVVVDGIDVSRTTVGAGIDWQGPATIKNVVARGFTISSTNAVNVTTGSGSLDGLDCELADLSPGNCLCIKMGGSANLRARNVEITADGQNVETIALAGSSVLRLSSTTFGGTHAGSSIGIAVASGCTLRLGPEVNLQASGLPLNPSAGSYVSRGNVILNGATPVSIPFVDLNGTDDVTWSYVTLDGGVIVTQPVWTLMPGTGMSVVAGAGDQEVLRWRIVE